MFQNFVPRVIHAIMVGAAVFLVLLTLGWLVSMIATLPFSYPFWSSVFGILSGIAAFFSPKNYFTNKVW